MSESDAKYITQALIDAVRGLNYDSISGDALEVARHCLLDYLGVALAGSSEPLVQMLVKVVALGDGPDGAGLIGRPERMSELNAALVNGAAAHALDYDDTHTTLMGHPTAPVMPAVLALCETNGANGKRLLESFVAGVELECRLGALLGSGHYDAGFHSTGTLGTFGAAGACAHLLGLGEDQWRMAMGLAGTQAAGLKASFGTMAKPLHAGKAASSGMLSALLAKEGFSGATGILETPQGFAVTHFGAELSANRLDRYVGKFLICDTLFKYHASCYLTHAPMDAARAIADEFGVQPESIDSVEVYVSPKLLSVCNIERPETGLEAKFSLRTTTALALLGYPTDRIDTFEDTVIREERLVSLRDRVRVIPTEGMESTQAKVIVESKGRTFERETDSGIPSRDLRAQGRLLSAKFMSLAAPVIGSSSAEALADRVLRIDEAESLDEIFGLLRNESEMARQ